MADAAARVGLDTLPSMSLAGAAVLDAYYALLAILCLFGLRRVYILVQYYRLRRAPRSATDLDPRPPPNVAVTVQLPIFNEVHMVERLLESVTRLDWPRDRLQIQVLDDSTDETAPLCARLCEGYRAAGYDIHHLHRPTRAGYKAGALADGLRRARGELVAIFDADFVPEPDFLRRTVPYFADPQLAFVQGGWLHMNRERSLLTRVQAILLDAHFRFEHTVRSLSGYFVNFTGTGGVWRARAIHDAGGWQHDTLIEDADLAYRAQMRGWRAMHLPDLFVACELPEDASAWRSQQRRWAKGNAQVMRKLMPSILRSSAPAGAKVECFLHLSANCIHPVNFALAVLLAPAMWLRAGTPAMPLLAVDAAVFLFNLVSVGAYFALSQRERPPPRRWLRELRVIPSLMALGIGGSLSQGTATVSGFWGHDVVFHRTPKPGRMRRPTGTYRAPVSRLVWLEGGLALAYAAAVVAAAGQQELWAAIPFLLLFFHGFSHVAAISVREALADRMAPLRQVAGAAP
jgi:cellulose synthase/poly-beta-1,6-N-acetylglucosamine synthase-like glycosyltransferase